jgi:hypothetical protein
MLQAWSRIRRMVSRDRLAWPRRLLRWLPFVLPPVALAIIVWLQPEDHMGPYPDRAPWLGKLVYDDWDWSACVLRGLNASMGRKAGLIEKRGLEEPEFCAALDDPSLTLAERYYLEYPLADTWFFRLPYLIHPVHAPVALCDGQYGNVIFHRPRNDAERDLWRTFRRIAQEYAACMVICLLLLMAVVGVGYEPGGKLSGPVWLLVLPGALYFALNRFDVLPAMLTAFSLACLGRRWLIASAFLLAAATMVKVYPVLLAPLVFRYLCNDRRAALTWATAYVFAVAAILLASLLATDWQSVLGPYQVQLSRDPMGPTIYDYVLPMRLAKNDALGRGFRFGTLALVMVVLSLTRPPDLASVLRRGAVVVIVFANLSVFYSPQWMLWFTPMLVPLAGRHRSVLILTIALDIVTYLTFPVAMLHWGWEEFGGALGVTCFCVLTALLVALVWPEIRRKRENNEDTPKGQSTALGGRLVCYST